MKTSTLLAITVAALLVVLAALGGWIGRGAWERRHTKPLQADTVCVWIRDTIKMVETKPAGTVVATLPVHHRTTVLSKDDNFMAPGANLLADNDTSAAVDHFRDSTKMMQPYDSVTVEIPIEERTYEGKNYRAVVRGFRPELASIDIRLPEIIPAEPTRKKGWSFALGLQAGYGLTPKGWQPYLGAGGTLGFSF